MVGDQGWTTAQKPECGEMQKQVIAAMTSDMTAAWNANHPSFLYLLGDIIYQHG